MIVDPGFLPSGLGLRFLRQALDMIALSLMLIADLRQVCLVRLDSTWVRAFLLLLLLLSVSVMKDIEKWGSYAFVTL